MKRSFARSPYLWALLGVATVVAVAWAGRESYRPVITGAVAPDYVAFDENGDEVAISDYKGRVVLVNIWATWCAPCLEEMPSIQRLYERLDGEEFEVLAISVDAPTGQVDAFGRPGGDLQAFADELGLTFPIWHDPSSRILSVYQTTGVPETFILDRQGVIFKKVAGPTEWDAPVNEELIRRLLGS